MAAAATMAPLPKRGLPGGGWLSMAPSEEVSAPPPPPPSLPPSAASLPTHHPTRPTKRATFDLGWDTSGTNTPVTPASRDDSAALSPMFDVRSSFAPLTFKRPAASAVATEPQDLSATQAAPSSSGRADADDDGHGIYFAGRQWKGKTAHAVEQEMEKVGDLSIMSYAPDAVYLASRLYGLQRNIEAGGDDARGRRWVDFGEHDGGDGLDDAPVAMSTAISPRAALQPEHNAANSHLPDDRIPAVLPPHITDYLKPPSPASTSSTLLPTLDPAAKAAALDSRVEIRLLRRSDLEQVRELHCLHGDSDKVDAEHYVTSAAFLLRLLVDESYVCVVAVGKPIPEPEAPLAIHPPASMVPRCPPPSMDIPATSAAYLFANRGIASQSPLMAPLDGSSAKRTRFSAAAPPSSLGRLSPLLGSTPEDDEDMRSQQGSDMADCDDDGDDGSSRRSSRSGSPPEGAANSLFSTSPRDAIAEARASEATGSTSVSSRASPSGMGPKRDYTAVAASHRDIVLAGPTNEVAPPRALRVMVPPAPGASLETETILGVAAASVNVRPATESLWGDADAEAAKPRKEIHLLTLAVARAERGLGLGSRLLEQVTAEAKLRNVGSAYRAQMGRRYSAASVGSMFGPTRTYLEVHAESTHALSLYEKHGFSVAERLKGYFRGDARIPTGVRSMPGGSDALLLERFEDVASR
ncbi:unnamed protein product [Parajaminaea phylloscopi]